MTTRLFPLFADLRDRTVLVVGGGAVARRKVEALLATGARIRVGAPRACSHGVARRRTDDQIGIPSIVLIAHAGGAASIALLRRTGEREQRLAIATGVHVRAAGSALYVTSARLAALNKTALLS